MKKIFRVLMIMLLVGTFTTPIFPTVEEEVQSYQIVNSYYKTGLSKSGFENYFYYLTVDINGKLELFEVGYDIYMEYMTASTIKVQTTEYSASWFAESHVKYDLIAY